MDFVLKRNSLLNVHNHYCLEVTIVDLQIQTRQ